MKVFLKRRYEANATPGILQTMGFSCATLELPNKNNQPKISCIPEGTYEAKYTYSPAFQKFTYEVQAVPGRSGIRVHSGNYTSQILGCILLGEKHADINKDGITDVVNSKATIKSFEEHLKKEPFTLIITSFKNPIP